MKDFELLEHTADLKLRVYGASKQELFKNALVGMFQSLRPISSVGKYEHDRFVCDAYSVHRDVGVASPDQTALLVDFLSAALYFSAVHHEAYFDVTFQTFNDTSLSGQLHGVPITGYNESEIKAVTYYDIDMRLVNGVWQTDIVFDI